MLEAMGLSKAYGSVVALDHVFLTASPGRILGFLGPNGAGKTTTMRAIFGLVDLDAGNVRWQGQSITAALRKRFGYMPEQRGLYPRMDVLRQLIYLGRLHGMDKVAARAAANYWLNELGLHERANDRLSQLSHGNQQRIQLAAALMHDPVLLVLDEPFSGLDPLGVAAMSRVLRQRAAEGATVVFSSHQLDLVEELCDDVVIVHRGRDQLAGTLDEIRRAAGYHTVELRAVDGVAITTVADWTVVSTDDDGTVRLQVSPELDPRTLIDSIDQPLERFSMAPPRLSEIFRSAIGRFDDQAAA